jgi:hypothetical protein
MMQVRKNRQSLIQKMNKGEGNTSNLLPTETIFACLKSLQFKTFLLFACECVRT